MLPELQTLERVGSVILLAAAFITMLRAVFILIFKVPAKATMTYDGYRRMCEARNSAVILHERPPMPFTVEDAITFSTSDGRKMHVTVRRYARPHDRELLVWYSPSQPHRIATVGPLTWLTWSVWCLATIFLLFNT